MPTIPPPPPTRRDPLVETLHGVDVPDPYRWLEDAGAPDVKAWVDAQNERTDAVLATFPQVSALRAEFERLWRYDDARPRVPCRTSAVAFFQTRRADQDKWVLHVRPDPDRPEATRVLLDPNTWGEHDELSFWEPSPDGRLLAYGVARAGDENPVARVIEVESGRELPDRLAGWKHYGVSWLADGSGFFYASKPLEGEVPPGEHHYWHRSRLHRLGTDGTQDPVVFADPAIKERYHWTTASEDGRFAVHHRAEFHKMQLALQRLPDGPILELYEGLDAHCEAVTHAGSLFVRTDWGATRYRLMRASVERPTRDAWVELVPEHAEELLESFAIVDGRLYVCWVRDATSRISVYGLDGRFDHDIALPEPGTATVSGYAGKGPVWVGFQSFTHPSVMYRYDPGTRALAEAWRSPVDVDPSGMVTEQVWVTSKDGTRLPMFVVRSRDARPDGDRPVLLTGYGGFNLMRRPGFSSLYVTWVASGGVFALGNLRGGGEYGAAWHEAGMRARKQNVFDDFVACAEHLIAIGWTRPEKLAISGGSNGGLLVSAAMTQRPELFRAVLCQVPLTDMLRFHRFGIANIWTLEYGSPDDPEMFPHLLAYSPYHAVREGVRYPALYVTGSANDARTDPVHARKLFAAVAGAAPDDPERPVLLRIEDQSGHTGAVTIADMAAQYARAYGFLMAMLGMIPANPSRRG